MPLRRASDPIRGRRHGTLVLSALVFGGRRGGSGCRETSSVVSPDPTPSVVSPDPAACTFDVAPAAQIINSGLGGSGTVTVATTSMCGWTATTDVGWITLTAPTGGNGNGTVNFAAAYNPGPERTGRLIIGGQPSTITQWGSAGTAMPCTYTIDPSSQTIGAAGGAGPGVQVYTSYGCRWIATSNAPWISVTWGGSGGAGFAVVTFSVAANTGDARTGRRVPAIDFKTAATAGLAGLKDQEVLALAAGHSAIWAAQSHILRDALTMKSNRGQDFRRT